MFKIEVENILNITLLMFSMDSTEKDGACGLELICLLVLLMCSISYTMFRGINVSVLILLNILFLSPFAFTRIYLTIQWVNLVEINIWSIFDT